jgi:hypothetical protein
MGLLAELRARAGGARVRFGRELRAVFLDARRVAAALRRHAARVPYAALAGDLRRLADQADGHAALLADELRAIAANADPTDATRPREGRNQWARMAADLADLEALQHRYAELARRWDVDFPDAASTLGHLAHEAAGMAAAVRTLVVRSDPHAAD